MTRESKIKELSADIRLAALNVDNVDSKAKLVKIAQGLDTLLGGDPSIYGQMGGSPEAPMEGLNLGASMDTPPAENTSASKPSRFGIDQEQQRYYKVTVEFLYIPGSDNLEARQKIMKALQGIPEFEGKFNVGEAQGMSVKEPS